MQISFRGSIPCLLGVFTFAALAASAPAAIIDLDGTTYKTLSEAVAAAYANEDGADIINIKVNALPTADTGWIVLDKPIIINGDAENGDGDGTPCDLIADNGAIAALAAQTDIGKAYIVVNAPGDVFINDLRIHPLVDGVFNRSPNQQVLGIRCQRPISGTDTGHYTFKNVEVSGSDASGNFINLATGADLYNQTDVKHWAGDNRGDNYALLNGVIQLDDTGAGVYDTVLDHCKAGLGYGSALNMNAGAGTHQVLGGAYGHCGRDGIHVQGPGVTIRGTHDDRVRIIRSTNISAANSHGFEMHGGSEVSLLEYVDIAGVNTANCISVSGGHLAKMSFVRAMGKFTTDTNNHVVYVNGATTQVDLVENCTFNGNSTGNFGYVPFQVMSTVPNSIEFKDSIFTCSAPDASSTPPPGTVTLQPVLTPPFSFTCCALPNDGYAGESLASTPLAGDGAATAIQTGIVSASPHYALTLSDYDWSDNQGAGIAGNGPGNANVFRPTNPVYNNAASGGARLNGGAGAAAAGIDASEWMLM